MGFLTKDHQGFDEMKLTPIPYSFIRNKVALSWEDALWGYEHQLIGWSDIVSIADDRLALGSDDPVEIELSSLGKSETHQIGELLRDLADKDISEHEEISEKKWLFLILSWLYDNRETIPNPLAEVEIIYADFDYPAEIEEFVSYMPVTDDYDPSQHSSEENKARLISKWEDYLIKTRHHIGLSDQGNTK